MPSPKTFSTSDAQRGVVISVQRENSPLDIGVPCSFRFCFFTTGFAVSGVLPCERSIESRCAWAKSAAFFFSASFFSLATLLAYHEGNTKTWYSQRAKPQIRAEGKITASNKLRHLKNPPLFTNNAERNIFKPLLSDVPAVNKK